MDRKEKLKEYIENNEIYYPLIDKIICLEEQLEVLEKLPKIRVSAKNPAMQKTTPAAKLYKEYLQQYLNAIRLLERLSGNDVDIEDSPLREWVRKRNEETE